MSTKLSYITDNPDSVRKAFEVLAVRLKKDLTEIRGLLNNNPILTENEVSWLEPLNREVEIIPEWRIGLACVRGRQVRYNNIVYRIIQTHVVTDENATPANTPALYRKAPVIDVGRLFPRWDSIGLLDSENFWLNGDIVDHNGQYWKSNVGNNVWEPGATGITQWDVFNPETGEPEPWGSICDGIEPWNTNQHWSTYTIGDKRTSNGGLYEVKDPQWAQSYAPHTSAGLEFGWNFIGNC